MKLCFAHLMLTVRTLASDCKKHCKGTVFRLCSTSVHREASLYEIDYFPALFNSLNKVIFHISKSGLIRMIGVITDKNEWFDNW